MRLFIGLDNDEEIRQRIRTFLDGVRGFAPDARWVKPESLHVTLKFIGEQSDESIHSIEKALAQVSGPPLQLTFRGHGFFPNPKSAPSRDTGRHDIARVWYDDSLRVLSLSESAITRRIAVHEIKELPVAMKTLPR